MISLLQILEANEKNTDFSAVSKKTGKLVYFATKDNMDSAVKAGTHGEPKIKGKDVKSNNPSDLFKGDYAKERGLDTDSDKSINNEPSEELVNLIINPTDGSSSIPLVKKNKNGKIVTVGEFNQRDITPELIKKVLEDAGIDINLVNSFGSKTKIKNTYGNSEYFYDSIKSLVFRNVELNQFAPDGTAEDESKYNSYKSRYNDIVNGIKKAITPKNTDNKSKDTVVKPNDVDSGNKVEYTDKDVSNITNILGSMDDNGGIFGYKPKEKDILKVANKYGVDVNRLLSNPERFIELRGYPLRKGETAKDVVLQALGHTASLVNSKDFLDSAYKLTELQLAYPLKHKGLSDSEWKEKMVDEDNNPTTIDSALRKFTKDENLSLDDINKLDKQNRNAQKSWVLEKDKNVEYGTTMMEYQNMISKSALRNIDNMLKSDPPPPIKAKALYRGMAMKPSDLNKFLKTFSEGNEIELPIASFSIDPTVASGFSNNVNNANATVSKANNQSVLIKVINSNNTFNGFAMNSNIETADDSKMAEKFGNWGNQTEVLMPSNNKYKVVKTDTKNMDNGRSITVITLELIGTKTESIKLKELVDSDETSFLKKHLQYPNRISLLYKNKKEE